MSYTLDFLPVLANANLLVRGLGVTLWLTAVGAAIGVSIGILGAVCRAWRLKPFAQVVAVYVEFIRNTPFLAQLFFIFFGLPALGVRLSGEQASVLAMVVNLGAYSTEIVRGGIEATPRGVMEAAESLALSRAQTFTHVVLRPALVRVWPALCSQVVIVMLGSAVCSQIATEDLTFAANLIQARNFRAFETYLVVTGMYLVLAVCVRKALNVFGRRVLSRRG